MMLIDLPTDLVEEILFRVPANSLKPLRSSCKRWNTLFKDRRFTETHFRNAPRQPRVLMLKERRLCSIRVDLNVVPPSIEFKDELSLNNSYSNSLEQVDIAEVSHCDGLLLCIIRNKRRPVVWNPCSGETRWIQHENSCRWIQHENGYQSNSVFALGYENNQSCRSYKALVFSSCWGMNHDQDGGFEIYEFSSNSWRVVNAPNCIRIVGRGVTLKGNAYWISEDSNKDDYLLSFDFTRESFRRLCFPPSSQNCYYKALSVVREEELSVLQFGSSKTEMWVTKNIDTTEAELSWRKPFAVDFNTYGTVFTSLLIDEEKKVALCCRLNYTNKPNIVFTIGEDDEYYTETPCVVGSRWPFIFNYVPSLVQIESKISK